MPTLTVLFTINTRSRTYEGQECIKVKDKGQQMPFKGQGHSNINIIGRSNMYESQGHIKIKVIGRLML